MSNPKMFEMPGAGAMNDTLEFVKNMWGGMKVPGVAMPSLSVDDINKQIADLKAVESWLTLNMNMLRGTIQALEVQSATLSTLQSMGEAMSAAIPKPDPQAKPDREDKNVQADQPAGDAGTAFDSRFNFAPPTADKPPAPQVVSLPDSPAHQESAPVFSPAPVIPPFADPAVWWNSLQTQFNEAVSGALAPPATKSKSTRSTAKATSTPSVKKASKSGPKSSSKSATKPAPKSLAKAPAKKPAAARKRSSPGGK